MGIRAFSHPRHQGCVRPSKGRALGLFTAAPTLQGVGEGITGRGITLLTVKQAGMTLPVPTKTAPDSCTVSCVITGHPVAELRGLEEFSTADHSSILLKERGGGAEEKHGAVRGSNRGYPYGPPCLICTSLAACDKDGGMAASAAVHSLRD